MDHPNRDDPADEEDSAAKRFLLNCGAWLLPLGVLAGIGYGVASITGFDPPKVIVFAALLAITYGAAVLLVAGGLVPKGPTLIVLGVLTAIVVFAQLDVPLISDVANFLLRFLLRG